LTQENLNFYWGDIILEGILSFPEGPGPFGLVVICHPHPLYGGSMDSNVVDAVCRGVLNQGLGWLKFNFRGVGKSSGSFDGGIGEQEDLKAAIFFAAGNTMVDPQKIGVCGYSFGSQIAFSVAAQDVRVKAVAGISPFVQPADLLNNYMKPKLFICGTNDEFIKTGNLERLFSNLPEPKELILFPGIDHFWWGNENKIESNVGQFFAGHL